MRAQASYVREQQAWGQEQEQASWQGQQAWGQAQVWEQASSLQGQEQGQLA